MGVIFMAEKEGFEPSIPFWGIHDFQSCALGQLRDFSKFCNQLAYNTTFDMVCQPLFLKIRRYYFCVFTDLHKYKILNIGFEMQAFFSYFTGLLSLNGYVTIRKAEVAK